MANIHLRKIQEPPNKHHPTNKSQQIRSLHKNSQKKKENGKTLLHQHSPNKIFFLGGYRTRNSTTIARLKKKKHTHTHKTV